MFYIKGRMYQEDVPMRSFYKEYPFRAKVNKTSNNFAELGSSFKSLDALGNLKHSVFNVAEKR